MELSANPKDTRILDFHTVVGVDPGVRNLLTWAPVTMTGDPEEPAWLGNPQRRRVNFLKDPARFVRGLPWQDWELARMSPETMTTKPEPWFPQLLGYFDGQEGISTAKAEELLNKLHLLYARAAENIALFAENYKARVAIGWAKGEDPPMLQIGKLFSPEASGAAYDPQREQRESLRDRAVAASQRGDFAAARDLSAQFGRLRDASDGDLRIRSDFSRSAFNHLPIEDFIGDLRFRLRKCGIEEPFVFDALTSRTCSRCQEVSWYGVDRTRFYCNSCRYEEDRDVNAAYNIAFAGWLHWLS